MDFATIIGSGRREVIAIAVVVVDFFKALGTPGTELVFHSRINFVFVHKFLLGYAHEGNFVAEEKEPIFLNISDTI